MGLVEDLKREFADGRALVVVGAGVSVQASGGAECASWSGLLRHAARQCAEVHPELKEGWLGRVVEEIASGDTDDLLSAAEKVTAKLGGRAGGEYRRWLHSSVGGLSLAARGIVDALRDLGAPLCTTNYDGLLEGITGLRPITWRDHAGVEAFLQGREPAILHLHGYWREPESVVLGIRSYEAVLGDSHAQAALRALLLTRTLVFAGFGAGLEDPNFGELLKWRAANMSGSESRGYRLARDGECAEVQKQHPDEQRVVVVGYGKDYSDLPGFLRTLSPRRSAAPSFVPGLPAPGRCFGRDREVQMLVTELLSPESCPVPVLGGAGFGKSTLTIAVLHHPEIVARFGARRYFVRCEAARCRADVAAAAARHLAVDSPPDVERILLARLAEAPAVLVLDNFETPWDADGSQVEELLANLDAVPGLGLLVSIRGAQRPGGVRWAEPVRLERLALEDARTTFLDIAGRKFAADPLLDSLLDVVDHVPLAITLLAYAAEADPDLSGIWQRWHTERTAMLRRGAANERRLNMELSYELSLKSPRITEDARRLLSVLALLPNGVAHADLAELIPGALGAASVLRATSLAYDETGRLRLLAPVREYVARRYPPKPADAERAAAGNR